MMEKGEIRKMKIEKGMTKPFYCLESEKYGKDLYSFRLVKYLITRKVFAD